MKYFILVFFAATACLHSASQESIYSFTIDSVAGGKTIDFSSFQGRKILLINAASGDTGINKYAQIKQLNSLYRDSLVIVVFPSNSFNNENTDEATMLAFYSQEAGNPFPVTKKIDVKGEGIHPLYQWLTQKSKNGVMDSEVGRPYQKYLVSKSGKLIGVFSARIKPFDPPLVQAITNSSN